MTYVVDCSIIIRLLASKPGDELLRQRLARPVHAPALIDAEVSSVVRGLVITTKPNVRITVDRASQMLADYAGLRIIRHAMQPLQARVFEMRHNFSAYDAIYVALAESLGLPLLTDDGKFAATPGHAADIHQHPDTPESLRLVPSCDDVGLLIRAVCMQTRPKFPRIKPSARRLPAETRGDVALS